MTCDVRLNKEVQLMHKTPIILIKKDRETMYVSKYMIRKTNGGQLILDLIKYMGSLHTLEKLKTEEAYFALPHKDYYSSRKGIIVESRVGEQFATLGQERSVVVTLNDKDRTRYFPYRITIFGNNVEFLANETDNFDEIATDEAAIDYYAKEGEKKRFRFKMHNRSKPVDLEAVYTERDPYYACVKNVGWINDAIYYKEDVVVIFSKQWAKDMLEKLESIDAETKVYPTLSGEWIEYQNDPVKKVLPKSEYGRNVPKKEFWREYLSNFTEVKAVYLEKFFKGGRVV